MQPLYTRRLKWMHAHGIDVDVIVGSKTKDMLILEKEMEAVAGNYYPCTDDGTYGHARYGNNNDRSTCSRR